MDCSMPGFLVLGYLTKFAHTHIHWVSDAIQPSHPLPPPSSLAFHLSKHQSLFQWVSSLHQVAKLLELQLQHQSLQWISGLISFRINWFSLFAVQGILKILLQHHSLKTFFSWKHSVLRCSALFMVQFSHPYMTTGKTIAMTRQTFVGNDVPDF